MKSRIRRRPLLLAAVLLLATLPQPRLALCVGDGGHRELELLSADCCPSEAESATHDELEAGSHGCAPDCTDTPLGDAGALESSAPTSKLRADLDTPTDHFALASSDASSAFVARSGRGRDGPRDVGPYSSLTVRSAVRRL